MLDASPVFTSVQSSDYRKKDENDSYTSIKIMRFIRLNGNDDVPQNFWNDVI